MKEEVFAMEQEHVSMTPQSAVSVFPLVIVCCVPRLR